MTIQVAPHTTSSISIMKSFRNIITSSHNKKHEELWYTIDATWQHQNNFSGKGFLGSTRKWPQIKQINTPLLINMYNTSQHTTWVRKENTRYKLYNWLQFNVTNLCFLTCKNNNRNNVLSVPETTSLKIHEQSQCHRRSY